MIRSMNGGARRQRFTGPWNQNPWLVPQNVGPRAREQQPIALTLYAPVPPMVEPSHMSQLNTAHAKNLRKSRQLNQALSVWEDDTQGNVIELDRPAALDDFDDPELIREMSRIREDDM